MGLPPAALFDWRRHNCRHPRWQRRKTENRNEEPLLCLAAIHLQLLLQSLLSPSACSCQKAAPNLRSERRAVECRNWHGLYPMSDYRYFLGYHRSAIRCPAPLRRCTKRGTITLEKTVSPPSQAEHCRWNSNHYRSGGPLSQTEDTVPGSAAGSVELDLRPVSPDSQATAGRGAYPLIPRIPRPEANLTRVGAGC